MDSVSSNIVQQEEVNVIFTRMFLGAVLACFAFANQATACPYIDSYKTLVSQLRALDGRVDAISEENQCSTESRRTLNELLSVTERMADMLSKAQSIETCNVNDKGVEATRINAIKKILAGCAKAQQKAGQQTANCVTPPAPVARRRDEWWMCLKGTNTNTNEHCRYSFSYTKRGTRQHSKVLGPGESDEACSSSQNVDNVFEKWTRSVPSGK